MKVEKDLIKEKDFLSDSVTFYQKKHFRPSLNEIKNGYQNKRTKPDFEENDFIDASEVSYTLVHKIYLIGLAEYQTSLSFREFLYLVFVERSPWENIFRRSKRTIRRWYSYRTRFEDHVFRTKHKFQQHGVKPKEENEKTRAKKDWREHCKVHKDKSKPYFRYRSYSSRDRVFSNRRERRSVRASLHSGKEINYNNKKDISDYWD